MTFNISYERPMNVQFTQVLYPSGWFFKPPKNDPTKAYCALCFKSISIARNGEGNLDEHANGKKHISKVPCSKQTLLAFTAKQEKQAVVTTSTDKSQNQLESHKPSKQSSVNSYILSEAVTDAEIFWIIEVVLKKYSLNSCDGKKAKTIPSDV